MPVGKVHQVEHLAFAVVLLDDDAGALGGERDCLQPGKPDNEPRSLERQMDASKNLWLLRV
jgi:hypothetical protein